MTVHDFDKILLIYIYETKIPFHPLIKQTVNTKENTQ